MAFSPVTKASMSNVTPLEDDPMSRGDMKKIPHVVTLFFISMSHVDFNKRLSCCAELKHQGPYDYIKDDKWPLILKVVNVSLNVIAVLFPIQEFYR